MDQQQLPQIQDDEIDLFELFGQLWDEKFLIIGATFVFGALAVAYSFLVTPVYEAKIGIKTPTIDQASPGFPILLTSNNNNNNNNIQSQIISRLNQRLASLDFFQSFYPQATNPFPTCVHAERYRNCLAGVLQGSLSFKILDPAKNNFALGSLDAQLTYKADIDGASILASYVSEGVVQIKAELVDELGRKNAIDQKNLERSIEELDRSFKAEINREIYLLAQDVRVAKVLGIEEPQQQSNVSNQVISMALRPANSGDDAVSGGNAMSGAASANRLSNIFLGSRALEEQIKNLQERRDQPALFDPRRPPLTQSLQRLETQAEQLREWRDLPLADVTQVLVEGPVSPKKQLIVALAVVVGGMLAVMFVLVRNAVRNRKARMAEA